MDWPGHWFARWLSHRQIRPVCQIEYRRTARLGCLHGPPAVDHRSAHRCDFHQHSRFHVSFGRRDYAGPGSARIEVPRSRATAFQATDREIQPRAPGDLQVPNGHGSPGIGCRFRSAGRSWSMPEFLNEFVSGVPAVSPLEVTIRLVAALLAESSCRGSIGQRDRIGHRAFIPGDAGSAGSPHRLGDRSDRCSVARAFSLVGALSIVRFRTVVRDMQDTAYVIFAVVVGMAAGTGNFVAALIGIGMVGVAAFIASKGPYRLSNGRRSHRSFR